MAGGFGPPPDPPLDYDLQDQTFNNFQSLSAQDNNPQDVAFRNNGLKYWMLGGTGNDIQEYTLGTAWTINTGVTVGGVHSISGQTTNGDCFAVSEDGLHLFVGDSSDGVIYEYGVSPAWDIAGVTYESKSLDTGPGVVGMSLNLDGTQLWISRADGTVELWEFGTAYDISSLTDSGKSVSMSTGQSLFLTRDGRNILTSDSNILHIRELNNAWNIDTAQAEVNYTVPLQTTETTTGLYFQIDVAARRGFYMENAFDTMSRYFVAEVP